jgi:DNA-binding response OmpR family regulator
MKKIYKVLLLESDISSAKVIQYFLQKYNFQVDHIVDGNIAIEKVKRAKYDLIILDLKLSNMDGFEFIGKIKEDRRYDLFIIILTASGDKSFVQKATLLDVDQYLLKPMTSQKLLEKIIEILAIEKEELIEKILYPIEVFSQMVEDSILVVEVYGCSPKDDASLIFGRIEKEWKSSPNVPLISIVFENKFILYDSSLRVVDRIAEQILAIGRLKGDKILFEGDYFRYISKEELEITNHLKKCKVVFPKK